MAEGIIVAGQTIPVLHPDSGQSLSVHAWSDPPGSGPRVPEFKPGDGFNKARKRWPIDLCVWHWTGGEGEPDRVAETLRARKFGVEFAIGRTGSIWQFCDPFVVDTADAGFANARSVGVEVVCYGYRSLLDPARALRVGPMIPALGRDRSTYEATIHGRRRKLANFYRTQIDAAIALADALSKAVPEIAREVPTDSSGALVARTVDVEDFSGHLGHYHLTERKLDPGFDLLEALRGHFASGGARA
jgi:hypothetical protein